MLASVSGASTANFRIGSKQIEQILIRQLKNLLHLLNLLTEKSPIVAMLFTDDQRAWLALIAGDARRR